MLVLIECARSNAAVTQRCEPNYEYEQDYHHPYEELSTERSSSCVYGDSCFYDDNLVPCADVTEAYADVMERELMLLKSVCKVFTDIDMVPHIE
eukprot:4774-Heterococcus_DN1.PRE.2